MMTDKSDLVQIEEMARFTEILLNVEKQMQEINDSILQGKGSTLKNQIVYGNYADIINMVSRKFRMQIMTDHQNIIIGGRKNERRTKLQELCQLQTHRASFLRDIRE